ncbi:Neuferricin-like [Oopsacas minuta]|uniref:Neuferricin-like n=1 Tax=Oopsacas minuta TaxID=111878 RepID=A0AAV7KGM5_9METZ|nr:Neuferricin-like [Oopsacas minuta]
MADTNITHRGMTSDFKALGDINPPKKQQKPPVENKQTSHLVYTTAKILIILIAAIIIYLLYTFNYFNTVTSPATLATSKVVKTKGPHYGSPTLTGRLYTREELAKHDSHGSPILLAIMGRVYDVTSGQAYHPDSSYPFFAGIDGTRAFATGEFNKEGLIDDITGLDHDSIRSIADWVNTYDEEYTFVGRLIGTYFDENGQPTQTLVNAEKLLKKANANKATIQRDKAKFPPCNGRFSQAEGQVIWCSTKSGGIERLWTGRPRKYFDPTIRTKRCACVRDSLMDSPLLELYEGCHPDAIECKISK